MESISAIKSCIYAEMFQIIHDNLDRDRESTKQMVSNIISAFKDYTGKRLKALTQLDEKLFALFIEHHHTKRFMKMIQRLFMGLKVLIDDDTLTNQYLQSKIYNLVFS